MGWAPRGKAKGKSSLTRVVLGTDKILTPDAPWVLNLRASRMLDNAYMW